MKNLEEKINKQFDEKIMLFIKGHPRAIPLGLGIGGAMIFSNGVYGILSIKKSGMEKILDYSNTALGIGYMGWAYSSYKDLKNKT